MSRQYTHDNFHAALDLLHLIPVQVGQPIMLIFFSPFALLLCWRLWAFTLRPAIHPDEPKELPYWIPYLGHAIGFVKNVQQMLTRGREYFGNTREPFALTLGGQRLYVLTSPEDVKSLYKNAKVFIFDDVVFEVSITFGISHPAMVKMRQKPAFLEGDPVYSEFTVQNMHALSLAELNSEFWKQELHPGHRLDALLENFLLCIDTLLQFEGLPQYTVVQRPSNSIKQVFSLLKLTEGVMMDAGTIASFGTKILEIDPNLVQKFLNFDDENWKLWYKWPNANAMHAAKAEMTKTFEKYLSLPQKERGGAAHIIELIETTTNALELSKKDIATSLTMLYFVFNTNTYKVCFWALSHLLHKPSLHVRIRQETESAFLPNGRLDLEQLSESPLLDALFAETLRYYSASYSIRTVAEPTILGGKRFGKGSRIIAPFRQLHFDPTVYGHDSHVFDPDRFLRDKTLTRGASYRPFGGGTSYCPGRFLAKQEVKAFIAMVLHRFEFSLDGKQDLPLIEDGKPTTGIAGPVNGDDVYVRVKVLDVK